MKVLFAVALLLAGTAFVIEAAPAADFSFDYMLLVQQWPVTQCLDTRRSCFIDTVVKGYTLHGLWPNRNSGSWPQYCYGLEFNAKKIVDLVPRLDVQWPNLFNDTDKTNFWKHEYERHGSCASVIPDLADEFKFFSKVLDLHLQVNIRKVLRAAGIESGKDGYYPKDFINPLKEAFGAEPILYCGHPSKETTQVLQQIAFCMDKQFNIFECNDVAKKQATCTEGVEIYYPYMQFRGD
eukprot:Colp12_sorted_trinity150504_noHs@25457